MTDSDLLDSNSPPERESPVTPTQVCPICGAGRMIVIEEFRDFSPKPTASEGLNGLDLRQETESGPSQRL